jgi:hypothetical protein
MLGLVLFFWDDSCSVFDMQQDAKTKVQDGAVLIQQTQGTPKHGAGDDSDLGLGVQYH